MSDFRVARLVDEVVVVGANEHARSSVAMPTGLVVSGGEAKHEVGTWKRVWRRKLVAFI